MPISRRARMTRTAISPRLATRTFPNTLRPSLPNSSRTRGSPRGSSPAAPRARAAPRASSGCGSGRARPWAPRCAARRGLPLSRPSHRGSGTARPSKRDVSVLARRALGALGPDHLERFDQVRPGLARVYDVVYVAHLGGDHRVVELLLVGGYELGPPGLGVFGLGDFAPEDDVNRSGRPHDGDLPRRPRDVDVGAYVLGVHDVVG